MKNGGKETVFNLHSIELECINVALQNELEKSKTLFEDVRRYQCIIEELKQSHADELEYIAETAKATVKAKKQKYIAKFKELEVRFTSM